MREPDISSMSNDEKEAFINTIETMIDYGDGDCLTSNDIKLYDALIAERTKNNKGKADTLDNIISSAQARCDEQKQTDISPVRDAR